MNLIICVISNGGLKPLSPTLNSHLGIPTQILIGRYSLFTAYSINIIKKLPFRNKAINKLRTLFRFRLPPALCLIWQMLKTTN